MTPPSKIESTPPDPTAPTAPTTPTTTFSSKEERRRLTKDRLGLNSKRSKKVDPASVDALEHSSDVTSELTPAKPQRGGSRKGLDQHPPQQQSQSSALLVESFEEEQLSDDEDDEDDVETLDVGEAITNLYVCDIPPAQATLDLQSPTPNIPSTPSDTPVNSEVSTAASEEQRSTITTTTASTIASDIPRYDSSMTHRYDADSSMTHSDDDRDNDLMKISTADVHNDNLFPQQQQQHTADPTPTTPDSDTDDDYDQPPRNPPPPPPVEDDSDDQSDDSVNALPVPTAATIAATTTDTIDVLATANEGTDGPSSGQTSGQSPGVTADVVTNSESSSTLVDEALSGVNNLLEDAMVESLKSSQGQCRRQGSPLILNVNKVDEQLTYAFK